MNKKEYQKPAMQVVKMQPVTLLQDSITGVDGNASLNYKGGGSGPARGRESSTWDDDE